MKSVVLLCGFSFFVFNSLWMHLAEAACWNEGKAEASKSAPAAPAQRSAAERSDRENLLADKAARPRCDTEDELREKEAAEKRREAEAAMLRQNPAAASEKYKQAQTLENRGDVRSATKLYRQVANAGNGPAALRLCEIYKSGRDNVPRDYAEHLRWCAIARSLGVAVPIEKQAR